MTAALRLTVVTGPHRNETFCFDGAAKCTLGRAADCLIQLAGTDRDCLISRHHCELRIAPPMIRIRDLDSQNGTFLNGKRVESVKIAFTPDGDAATPGPEYLTVGGTTLRVDMVDENDS
jgi:pSer/pThr/pTyr-binding forkhead associated (FHA) protein